MKTLLFCVFFAPLLLQARQPALHGVITILNSRFDKGKTEYVQDAEIREASGPGNTPIRSGPDGQFRLDIAGDLEKAPAFLKVSKAG